MSEAVQGTVIRFDQVKGYGFIAPKDGREDIFVHVNEVLDDKYVLEPGAAVEFIVEQGERGLKASSVRVVSPRSTQRGAVGRRESRGAGQDADARGQDDGDGFVDVLSRREALDEITERLLSVDATLTAGQILAIRKMVVDFCAAHDWVS